MASQAEEADVHTANLPASPESQRKDSDTDSVPDLIKDPQVDPPEEADVSKEEDSPAPPPCKEGEDEESEGHRSC